MSIRHILLAAATAAILAGTTYGVMAQTVTGSQNGTVSYSSQSSGNSTSVVVTGSSQFAAGSAGSAGSDGGGFAGGGSSNHGALAVGGASNDGWAEVRPPAKKHRDKEPPEVSSNPDAGASPLQCSFKVTNWWEWRKLRIEVRRLALNCECPTWEPLGLQPSARKECPHNALEIFTARAL